MPTRMFTWVCLECHEPAEHVTHSDTYEFPDTAPLECEECGVKPHKRDKIPRFRINGATNWQQAPMVSGGSFDTVGRKPLTPLPEAPPQALESVSNFRDWIRDTPERREATRLRKEEMKRNKAKQKRAALIKKGHNIDLRTDKLPGDPKMP